MNKAGVVLYATHAVTDAGGVSSQHDLLCRYNIVELPSKYRRILEKHSKQHKLIDGDTLFAGGVAFLLNGMKQYWSYGEAYIELEINDCVGEQPEMLIERTLVYYLTYQTGAEHRRGTVGKCTALTPQKRLMCLADVFEVERAVV
ncbi:MAG TPA: hypothetical protein O0X42_00180 [Methanocorpusculum sp.]|nr:hypothetical protein [Methanocorpusculum sp.]